MIGLGIVLSENAAQVVIYDIRKKSLRKASMAEVNLLAKDSLLINFDDLDERLFVQEGIPTISMQTFLSMCCGYVVKEDEINRIFKHTTGIHYTNVFCNKQVDFSILYSSQRFWNRMGKLIDEGMDMLKKQGSKETFELEVRVTSVLHRMFDSGYPLDTRCAKRQYGELQGILSKIKRKMKESGAISLNYFISAKKPRIR